jgi:hypothetical protein
MRSTIENVRWFACVLVLAACQAEPAARTVKIPSSVESQATATTPKRAPKPDDAVRITLERTVCFGSCPAYRVSLDADGTVTYEGQSYVKERGPKTKQVAAAEFRSLVLRFESGEFEALSPPWKCPPIQIQTSDMPSATLTLERSRGRAHKIEHYLGDGCAPKVLVELEDAVDAAVDVKEWIRCPPDGWCPDP